MNSTEENTMLNLGLKLGENLKKFRLQRELTPVSYTHLTLPTSIVV